MFKHDLETHDGKGNCRFKIERTNVDKDPLRIIIRKAENDPTIDLLNTREDY